MLKFFKRKAQVSVEELDRQERLAELQAIPTRDRPEGALLEKPANDVPYGEEKSETPLVQSGSHETPSTNLSLSQKGIVSRTLARSPVRLNLGAAWHSMLAGDHIETYKKAIEDGKHTCCVCGICLPGYMQIHHLDENHMNNKKDNLRPICAFCHDIEHIYWASARQRVVLIAAPDIDQIELTRMAWAVTTAGQLDMWLESMVSKGENETHEFARINSWIGDLAGVAVTINANIQSRKNKLKEIIGDADPESLWNSVQVARKMSDDMNFSKIVDLMDDVIKIWPTAAVTPYIENTDAIAPSSFLSVWHEGQYKDISKQFQNDCLNKKVIDIANVAKVNTAISDRILEGL